MKTLTRPIVFVSLTAALVPVDVVLAFTDANAELKEAAAEKKLARVVVTAKAGPPTQAAWVPVSPKRLDSFKPVLPARPDTAQALAKAELPVAIKR